jgi:hypothetical protein
MKKFAAILLVVLCLLTLVGYYGASPYLVIHRLQRAAKTGNTQAISTYVDFPSVRESLKSQFNAKMSSDFGLSKSNGFGKLGAAFASALIDPMVDAFATPQNMARMIQGKPIELMPGTTKLDPTDFASATAPQSTMHYETKDRFVIEMTGKDSDGKISTIGLVFQRGELFSWKLSSLRLPMND